MSVDERMTDVLKAISMIKTDEDPSTLCSSSLIADQTGLGLDEVHETLGYLVDEELIEAPNKLFADDKLQDWHVDRLTYSGKKWLEEFEGCDCESEEDLKDEVKSEESDDDDAVEESEAKEEHHEN